MTTTTFRGPTTAGVTTMPKCLNPRCHTDLSVVGVCLSCANGNYKPKRHGVDLGDGMTTRDGGRNA